MKRITSLMIALLLTASLFAGCQDGGSGAGTQDNEPTTNDAANDPEDDPAEDNTAADGETQQAAPAADGAVVQAILGTYSEKEFADGAVSSSDLDLILQSGAKAPSARNLQPWHFTAITDSAVARQVLSAAPDGAAVIVISGSAGGMDGLDVSFDCGLATAYMYVAAQSLGYGAHIYMGGVDAINSSMRDALGIPDGYDALMILLVANRADGADAVSSATDRNPLSVTVTYID